MKKIIIILTVVFINCSCSPKRTPENIIKSNFDIELKKFDYSVEFFEEHWYLNGDGDCTIRLKIDSYKQEDIDYLINKGAKSLPISDMIDINHGVLSKYIKDTHKGYYFKWQDEKQKENFSILIFDTENNEALFYIDIM